MTSREKNNFQNATSMCNKVKDIGNDVVDPISFSKTNSYLKLAHGASKVLVKKTFFKIIARPFAKNVFVRGIKI